MTQKTPDPARDPAARRALIGLLVGLAFFLVVLVGVGVWMIRAFVFEPQQTVIVTSGAQVAPAAPGRAAPPPPADMAVIGGTLKEPQGAPIADARIEMTWQQLGERKAAVQTDAQGHWSYPSVPRSQVGNVKFSISKPDYITTAIGAQPADTLLKQTIVFVIPHAGGVAGDVVDSNGRPLANAEVTTRTAPVTANNDPPHGQTDDDGHFGVGPLNTTVSTTITVTLAGYAPAMQAVQAANPAPTIHFVMTPGRTLKGQVTDAANQPIAGAAVALNTWHGVHSFELNATTGKDGRFEVHDAPPDQVALRASKNGYNFNIVTYSPTTNDGQYRLSLTPTITGTVTDAKTHKPIAQFNVIIGFRRNPDQPANFVANTSRVFRNGKFTVPMHGVGGLVDAWFIRILADGHLPADSGPIAATATPGTQDFALDPGSTDVKGTVLDPAGHPAQGVEMVEILAHSSLNYPVGLMIRNRVDTTDAQGIFHLPIQKGDFILCAFSPIGFAQLDQDAVAKNADMRLTAWGQITGTFTRGGNPVPDQEIRARLALPPPSAAQPFVAFSGRTNAQGQFTITQVPPGDLLVGPVTMVSTPNGGPLNARFTRLQTVKVSPGQTVQVELAQ
ncbi:MAG: carboxypeptidase-like regulatory domain-containing protein [Tepidisphaeraceae bacterium]|jgi:protocatechuate 3,4-dioxygenase beta subunit